MNIAVTGYYGTGSSAVIDLLSEYEKTECAIGRRYEHYSLLGKNAIFDLENRLFSENSNYMIQDYAINAFIEEMKRQNDNDFGWYGSYKKLFGKKFMNIVNEFVENISEEGNTQSFSNAKGVKFSFFKIILQLGAFVLKGRKVAKWGRKYTYDKKSIRFLKVDHDKFLMYAKKFINQYFDLCQTENNMVYDHLLLPEQCNIVDKFFGNDFKLIIVDRDPRDIYISNKYIWSQVAFGLQKGPLPNSLKGFCRQWKLTHENSKKLNSKNVLIVQFEDLVYNYDETVKKIENFCNLKEEEHTKIKKIFEPCKSINNTQVFNLKQEYKEEILFIESELSDYLYNFPYKNNTSLEKVFDN